MTAESALNVAMQVDQLTSNPDTLQVNDVDIAVQLLERIAAAHANNTEVQLG